MCYACQVWGYSESKDVEAVLCIKKKKNVQLPHNTPNYALYIEKGLNKLLIHTLDMNINSILRVLSLPPNRLPNILARLIYKIKHFWG